MRKIIFVVLVIMFELGIAWGEGTTRVYTGMRYWVVDRIDPDGPTKFAEIVPRPAPWDGDTFRPWGLLYQEDTVRWISCTPTGRDTTEGGNTGYGVYWFYSPGFRICKIISRATLWISVDDQVKKVLLRHINSGDTMDLNIAVTDTGFWHLYRFDVTEAFRRFSGGTTKTCQLEFLVINNQAPYVGLIAYLSFDWGYPEQYVYNLSSSGWKRISMPFYPDTPAPTLRGLFPGIYRARFCSPFSGSWNDIDIDADLRGPIGDTVRTYSFEIYYLPENPADTVVLSGYPIFEQRYLCMDYDDEFNNELHFGTVSREITFSPPDTLPCDYLNGKILASETWQYGHADGNGEVNPVTVIYPRYGYKTFPQWPGAGVVPYSLDIKYRRRGLLSEEEEFIEPVVFEHTYQEIEKIIANINVLKDSSELAPYWNARGKQSCNEVSFNFSLSVFPSPFNEQATITVTAPENDFLTIDIYDLSSKLVKRLFSGNISSGESNFRWDCDDLDGSKVSNGIYFAKAVYQGKSIQTKLILAR